MAKSPLSLIARLRQRVNRTAIVGFLRGLVGDKIPQPWRGEMHFAEQGKILNGIPTVKGSHACVFIHGSADTELGWQARPGELDYGQRLLLDFNIRPLYVRYNSGLTIHDNGVQLSRLISKLVAKNKRLRRISLIGHSMGGLVIHAALADAQTQKLPWVNKVKKVFLLGTPHAGAPLAKLAEKAEQVLQFIPNPATILGASVFKLRSHGLRDLSHGLKGIATTDLILLPRADYIFIAGTLAKKPGGPINRIFGDGMVRTESALPQVEKISPSWKTLLTRFAIQRRVYVENLPGIGHLALRSSEEVYRIIAKHVI